LRTKSILFSFSKFAAGVIMTLVAALTISAKLQAAENCGALASGVLQGATVKSAEMRPAGRFSSSDGHYPAELPAFCRVIGKAQPTSDSDIGFELWMPPAESWNHKLLVVGNGGYVGEIRYDELEPALQRGYAVVSSDGGHTDQTEYRNEQLNWGVGHPEKIADWAYRSVHAAAEVSRLW
jgi:feruloyl esterase